MEAGNTAKHHHCCVNGAAAVPCRAANQIWLCGPVALTSGPPLGGGWEEAEQEWSGALSPADDAPGQAVVVHGHVLLHQSNLGWWVTLPSQSPQACLRHRPLERKRGGESQPELCVFIFVCACTCVHVTVLTKEYESPLDYILKLLRCVRSFLFLLCFLCHVCACWLSLSLFLALSSCYFSPVSPFVLHLTTAAVSPQHVYVCGPHLSRCLSCHQRDSYSEMTRQGCRALLVPSLHLLVWTVTPADAVSCDDVTDSFASGELRQTKAAEVSLSAAGLGVETPPGCSRRCFKPQSDIFEVFALFTLKIPQKITLSEMREKKCTSQNSRGSEICVQCVDFLVINHDPWNVLGGSKYGLRSLWK